jgi:hypothetical protein
MVARFRRLYGENPLHLLTLTAAMLIAGAAIAGWFDAFPGPTAVKILEWFVVAIVAHDLVGLPLYSLLDRIAFGPFGEGRAGPAPERVPGFVYVRVPALLSGLLLLVFFPAVLRLGDSAFFTASGFHQRVFLARYLITCGALFGLSALAYAVSRARGRGAGLAAEPGRDVAVVAPPERGAGGVEADRVGEQRRGGDGREHEVGTEPEEDHPQLTGSGERGERERPEDVPRAGPAERGEEHQQRRGRGDEPGLRSAPGPDRTGRDGERVDDADDGVQGGGPAAEPERQPDEEPPPGLGGGRS